VIQLPLLSRRRARERKRAETVEALRGSSRNREVLRERERSKSEGFGRWMNLWSIFHQPLARWEQPDGREGASEQKGGVDSCPPPSTFFYFAGVRGCGGVAFAEVRTGRSTTWEDTKKMNGLFTFV